MDLKLKKRETEGENETTKKQYSKILKDIMCNSDDSNYCSRKRTMGRPMPTQYKVGSIMEMDCLMLH